MKLQNIYVLGGHKLALTYREKLLRARKEGLIFFDSLSLVDPDPTCFASSSPVAGHLLIVSTYADFIVECLSKSSQAELNKSVLIPDHTAPHLLFQVFLDLLQKQCPTYQIKTIIFEEDLKLPFQKNDTSGVSPVSYATWICPIDCDEPKLCPGIQRPRTWDFKQFFSIYKMNHQKDDLLSPHFFYCDQLAYGVVCLNLAFIKDEWKKLLENLQKNKGKPVRMMIATFSKCHGILGTALISAP
jgi:hypothetical protein